MARKFSPSDEIGCEKPFDLATFLMYIRFYDELGFKNALEFDGNYNYFSVWDKDKLNKVSAVLFDKNESNMIDYKNDHSVVLYNMGRMILLAMNAGYLDKIIDKEIPIARQFLTQTGEISGVLSVYNNLCYPLIKKVNKEFAKDNLDDTFSPVLYIQPYFDEDIISSNHAELFPIFATALYYTMIGFLMSNLDDIHFKEYFSYGEDMGEVNGRKLIKTLEDNGLTIEKTESFFKFASMYASIINHLEVSIGVKFNDRFSIVFKAIGDEYSDLFDTKAEFGSNHDMYDDVLGDRFDPRDTAVLLVRELHNPTSLIYVGDHPYDLRSMYLKHVYSPNVDYKPYFTEKLKGDVNIDYENLKNYKSVIDCHAYERAIKVALLTYDALDSNKDYVENFYKLKFVEKLITDAYKFWTTLKSPLKIEGIDDMCVEVEVGRSIVKKTMGINSIKWSIALNRVKQIITQFNARYCEAYALRKKKDEVEFYRKLESAEPGSFHFDSTEDAVRHYVDGELPYIVTIGSLSTRDLNEYMEKGNIDFKKLNKLSQIDKSVVDRSNKSPAEVYGNNLISTSILTGDVSKEITKILKDANYAEICYLSR